MRAPFGKYKLPLTNLQTEFNRWLHSFQYLQNFPTRLNKSTSFMRALTTPHETACWLSLLRRKGGGEGLECWCFFALLLLSLPLTFAGI